MMISEHNQNTIDYTQTRKTFGTTTNNEYKKVNNFERISEYRNLPSTSPSSLMSLLWGIEYAGAIN